MKDKKILGCESACCALTGCRKGSHGRQWNPTGFLWNSVMCSLLPSLSCTWAPISQGREGSSFPSWITFRFRCCQGRVPFTWARAVWKSTPCLLPSLNHQSHFPNWLQLLWCGSSNTGNKDYIWLDKQFKSSERWINCEHLLIVLTHLSLCFTYDVAPETLIKLNHKEKLITWEKMSFLLLMTSVSVALHKGCGARSWLQGWAPL